MANPLLRLLRLRSLLEDASRMDVERRVALAARIDGAQERERKTIRGSREQVLRKISEDAHEQAQHRTAEWMNVESAIWREQQLQQLAQAAQRRVVESREEFLERRKERQQVQSVLEQQRERLRVEQERRVQREIDDWFGMSKVRKRSELPRIGTNS